MNNNKVYINSFQTNKKFGTILKVEYDKVWGPQYLVKVEDSHWGPEEFWMMKQEITHQNTQR